MKENYTIDLCVDNRKFLSGDIAFKFIDIKSELTAREIMVKICKLIKQHKKELEGEVDK